MKNIELSKVNLYSVFRDLRINFWVIILAAFIGFFGSVTYFSYVHTSRYTSTMTVSVNLSGYTTDSTAVSLTRTVMIAEILDDVFQSDAMRDIVKKEQGTDDVGSISAVQLGETNLISVRVTDKSAEKAYNTLKSVYDNYPKIMNYVFSNVIIRVVENPMMPSGPSNAVSVRNTAVAYGLLAAIAMMGLIVVISYMRDTIKNPSDVEKELDTKLFAVVDRVKTLNRHLPKNKRNLAITNPLVGYKFSESFRRMAVKIESLKRTKGIKTVMVTSVAENEGKTSVSANIAIALAQNGNRVLVVDCDLKKPAIYHFFGGAERTAENDFHKYITEGGDITNYLKCDSETGIYTLDNIKPTPNSAEKLSTSRFKDTIKALKNEFDVIIIDTPPCGLTIDAEIVSTVADVTLLVVRQDFVRVADINDNIASFDKTYLAGCVFNDVINFSRKNDKESAEYSGYYYHEKQAAGKE